MGGNNGSINWDKSFWRSAFSEDNGTGSASRILSAATVVCSLVWISLVVWHTKSIPELGSVSAFDAAVVSVLYGINKVTSKVSDTVVNYRSFTSNQPPAPGATS